MSKILSNNGYIKGLPVSLLMSKSSLRNLMRISTDYLTELHQVYDDPEATHELSLREALMR
jgi:hypothetical protein